MTNVQNENIFPEADQEEKVLRLVFEESKGLRDEFAGRLIHNTDKIWSLQNVLIVLLGAYITFFAFIFGDGREVFNKASITCPMVLCFIFLTIALFLTLKGIIPKYTLFAPNPNNVYAFIVHDQKKTLKDFIETYLHHYKNALIKMEEVSILRKKVVYIESFSIIEFILSAVIYFIDANYIFLINVISLMLLILFVSLYMDMTYEEEKRINLLLEELNPT